MNYFGFNRIILLCEILHVRLHLKQLRTPLTYAIQKYIVVQLTDFKRRHFEKLKVSD